MRIGIYGGTFNPVHIGHMHVADTAARDLCLDKVFFVPSKNPYTKPYDEIESFFVRQMMVFLAVSDDDRFCVGMDYSESNKPTYTYQTVERYRIKYPKDTIYLIVGEDAFVDIKTWKNYLEIFKYIDGIYVYRRGKGIRPLVELQAMYHVKELYCNRSEDTIDISSSMIRKRLKGGLSCKYLLPSGVYEYILNHKLYKDWKELVKQGEF